MIRYANNEDVDVRPGDRVQLRGWFRSRDAVVVHVPGLSEPNREFDDVGGGVQNVGLRTSAGRIYGVFVDPQTARLRHTVTFHARGPAPGPLPAVLDDPVEEDD